MDGRRVMQCALVVGLRVDDSAGNMPITNAGQAGKLRGHCAGWSGLLSREMKPCRRLPERDRRAEADPDRIERGIDRFPEITVDFNHLMLRPIAIALCVNLQGKCRRLVDHQVQSPLRESVNEKGIGRCAFLYRVI